MNIKTWIEQNLKTDSIILEAGTYDGTDTLFFSDYFKDGLVYAFEPIISLYEIAKSKVSNRNNVKIYNSALSDVTGKSTIYFSDRFGSDWGSSSLLKPKEHIESHPEITFKEVIEIDCVNLDDFISENNISVIDFMWLDMQGYESFVLDNSPITLELTKYIYSEVSLIETYENVMLYPEFRKLLESKGFEVVFEDLPWKDMGNVLFKNTKL